MNLKETVAETLHKDLKYPRELPWEVDWGIVKEITDPNDVKLVQTTMTKPKEGYLPLQNGNRLYKVADNWRKRSGYRVVDEARNELASSIHVLKTPYRKT
jgi:hypothetical protein